MLKKLWSLSRYTLYLFIVCLLLLEATFRLYAVDFYGGNLRGLNEAESLADDGKPTILIIGDSFSADPNSYVKHLREALPECRIVNSAVPGTCIRQHSLFAKKRIRDFKPEILIYQMYVGNDLLEYRHPLGSPNISVLRKIYWWLSDRFLVLGYINAKLPQLRSVFAGKSTVDWDAKLNSAFEVSQYSQRSKMLFQAEPYLVEHTALLKEERKQDMQAYTQQLDELISWTPENCKVYLLIVPHCMQLGDPFIQRMQLIGAEVDSVEALTASEYPFVTYLEKPWPETKVALINSLIWLKEMKDSVALYYENDPHLTPEGQAELAKSFGQKLLEDAY